MRLLKGDYNFMVALSTILQRFVYHMYINIFLLANHITLGRRSIIKNYKLLSQTTYQRLFQNLNVVAMATTDRDAWLDL